MRGDRHGPFDGRSIIPIDRLDAAIFDTDGVITDTARVHAAAWKRMFDDFLNERARESGMAFVPFGEGTDYPRYVDGKNRYDGARSFLESRAIQLPFGRPDDAPNTETVCGLANKKDEYFLTCLRQEGADAYQSSVRFVRALKDRGMRTGIISASRNMKEVLRAAEVVGLFEVQVDGLDAADLGLKGKPDPAVFLEAAKRLGVEPSRTAVIEDALAGVEAGRRGGFALVIGVDRAGQADVLRKFGADLVVRDLAEVQIESSGADES